MAFNHLIEKNIEYLPHLKRTLFISYQLLKASFRVFIHAFYPDLFTTSDSDEIAYLYLELDEEQKLEKGVKNISDKPNLDDEEFISIRIDNLNDNNHYFI